MSMKQRRDEFINAPLVQTYLECFPRSRDDLETGFANGYRAGLADSELLDCLKWLNQQGGLGVDVHGLISAVILKAETV